MLNRTGARTQPCFTPLDTWKGSDSRLPTLTRASFSSCSSQIISTSFPGQRDRRRISQSVVRSTVSDAFAKSMKHTCRPRCCSLHFSKVCRATKIISAVEWFCLKPHWVSGIELSKIWLINLFSNIFANSLPATESKDIPRLFPHWTD